jgi:hypothetical protein
MVEDEIEESMSDPLPTTVFPHNSTDYMALTI